MFIAFCFFTFLYLIVSWSKNSFIYIAVFFLPELIVNTLGGYVAIKEWYAYALSIVLFSYVAKKNKKNNLAVSSCLALCVLSIACIADAFLYGVGGLYGASDTLVNYYSSYIAICIHACIVYSLIDRDEVRNGVRSVVHSVLYNTGNSYTCDIYEYESEECKS